MQEVINAVLSLGVENLAEATVCVCLIVLVFRMK